MLRCSVSIDRNGVLRRRWDIFAMITIVMAVIMPVPHQHYTSHAASLRTTYQRRALQDGSKQESQGLLDHLNEGSDEISAQDLEEEHLLEVLEDEEAHSPQTVKDPKECINWPMLHSRQATDSPVNQGYIESHRVFQRQYENFFKPGTLNVSPDQIFTKTFENYVDFVYWGFAQTVIKMSLFTDHALHDADHGGLQALEGDFRVGNSGFKWRFVHPSQANNDSPLHNLDNIHGVQELEGDYIAFIGNNVGHHQHFLLDHLGYIAFFRKTMPPTTKLLIADGPGRMAYHMLKLIDPDFAANRVHYLVCSSLRHCNQRVKIRNGKGSLKVVIPKSTSRHAELLEIARQWILEMRPPPPSFEQGGPHRTIIYYTRHYGKDQTSIESNKHLRDFASQPHAGAHSRAMDVGQEMEMISYIRHIMMRSGRQEKLVIFDGHGLSMTQQFDLFRSASMVIGAHGGGLGNLLWTLPGDSCHTRPKVLELQTNPMTPHVQHGDYQVSFYTLYARAQWLDWHHILYEAEDSESHNTFIDMGAFKDALIYMMDDTVDSRHEGGWRPGGHTALRPWYPQEAKDVYQHEEEERLNRE
jgi:hypothetical protein